MKRIKISSSLLLLSLASTSAFALQCPDKNNVPYCPTSGSTLLDETYPTQAYVISNQPMISSKESRVLTQNFVNKVMNSYDYKNVPQIILPMTLKDDYDALVASIKNTLTQKKVPPADIEAALAQVTMGPAKSYTWQQDWFESFVDLKTGAPVVRQIESYYVRVSPGTGEELASGGKECSLTNGDTLKTAYPTNPYASMEEVKANNNSFGSGEMGGDIEGAPGGFCMVGDNQGKSFTAQFCGDEKNVIQLQTSWLSVGHVDEIFKIMPTQYNDGRPKECEFSLMAASPKKALELMGAPGVSNIPFYDLDNSKDQDKDLDEFKFSRAAVNLAGNSLICDYMEKIMMNKPEKFQNLPTGTKNVFLKLLFGATAKAGVVIDYNNYTSSNYEKLTQSCMQNIDKVTNFEIQQVMKSDKEFMDLNMAIDQSIEADKALIKQKILSRLPQCAKYYNELDMPDLFYGSKAITTADGKLELKKPGTVDSFLPNPTNSVLMNKTVTFPDSGNKLFNNYMTEELNKRKMKADFISSWDYAHIGHGNIHCSSHSIPHCKPQPASR